MNDSNRSPFVACVCRCVYVEKEKNKNGGATRMSVFQGKFESRGRRTVAAGGLFVINTQRESQRKQSGVCFYWLNVWKLELGLHNPSLLNQFATGLSIFILFDH